MTPRPSLTRRDILFSASGAAATLCGTEAAKALGSKLGDAAGEAIVHTIPIVRNSEQPSIAFYCTNDHPQIRRDFDFPFGKYFEDGPLYDYLRSLGKPIVLPVSAPRKSHKVSAGSRVASTINRSYFDFPRRLGTSPPSCAIPGVRSQILPFNIQYQGDEFAGRHRLGHYYRRPRWVIADDRGGLITKPVLRKSDHTPSIDYLLITHFHSSATEGAVTALESLHSLAQLGLPKIFSSDDPRLKDLTAMLWDSSKRSKSFQALIAVHGHQLGNGDPFPLAAELVQGPWLLPA